MNKLLQYMLVEKLKLKRTFAPRMTWLMPALTLLIAFLLMGGRLFQTGAYNWWYVIMLPGATTLFCTLVVQKDANMKFQGVLALPVDPRKLWLGKALLCMVWLLTVCLIFFVGAMLGGLWLGQTILPAQGLMASVLLAVTFAWQIPLCLFLAVTCGMFITILINLAGSIVLGILFATREIWWVVPYAIPIRLMCPVLEILPNGIPAEAGDPLLAWGVILPGVLESLALCGVLLWLTAQWFSKREAL
ncbi:lantibiotic immunity ABC transporter MutE/EpiE family permease subunit [Paenibacillus agri]|uniref:Lantibiotic immunity ABC transporter MutE/EpiE family permease subunit n=1 Tax=Paenibacillus agri TaxID=2744309 RepID=A0A850ED55_9BACL|nr:lantibiotic immunity ABC transporter MutE/EpiE family permease subunit [Paenibacillus agri]NUU59135.1 lantibiotic immunity ABC transporter MutE/EpiE family permease subunit [Paenibacillus agri]